MRGVNALNGLLSFLPRQKGKEMENMFGCVNALNGLLSFLLSVKDFINAYMNCVNALNGLLSFLRYLLRTRINTGFAGSFLQVFV